MPNNVAVELTVAWGYDVVVALTLSPDEWATVREGGKLCKDGAGYKYEGEYFQDVWTFDECNLTVEYGDDGGTGFNGSLSDADVREFVSSGDGLGRDPGLDGERLTFSGRLIEGPNLDLLEIAGLSLSEEDEEYLWGRVSRRDLLLSTSCEETLVNQIDDAPGLADYYYEYTAHRSTLRDELRAAIALVLARRISGI